MPRAVPRTMRGLALGACLLAINGCQAIEPLFDPGVYADVEIHNRTLDALVYEDADGRRVQVPACDSVDANGLRLDTVTVHAAEGYVRAFGVNAAEFAGRDMHLVEMSSAAASGIPVLGPAPEQLPPCEGHVEAQSET